MSKSKNIVIVRDKEGNKFSVSKNDPRYLSGELTHINKGKITVKDKDGNTFKVSKDDPRYLSGEVVSINKNTIMVQDVNGNTFKVSKDDPRYLSGELVSIYKGKVLVCDKENNKFWVDITDSRYLNGELVRVNKGKITVKDKDGNTFKVSKDDPRYLSGELTHINKGKATIKCDNGKYQQISTNDISNYINVLDKSFIYDCKIHGDVYVNKSLKTQIKNKNIPEEYKVYCPKCQAYYLSDEYNYTVTDIDKCRKFFEKTQNNLVYSETFIKKYVPQFYKIIKEWEVDNIELNFNEKIYALVQNIKSRPKCHITNCNEFAQKRETSLYRGLFNLYCDKHADNHILSKEENDVKSFLTSLGISYIPNDRTHGKEIDIFIPNFNLGIEFNGLYWHSELFKDKYYHQEKYNLFKNKGINILTIWEDDWVNKTDIVKSIVMHKLNLCKRKFYARKCQIREVDKSQKDYFLLHNHIQGTCVSSINIGLFYDNELLSLMTFGKSRFEKGKVELLRFCTALNTVVVGGASKLLKHFTHKYNPLSIISYANCDISNGNLYEQLGFKFINQTIPDYWWVKGNERFNRYSFQKHKLIKDGFNPLLTEVEIMHQRGFNRLYGNGNLKYLLTVK